MGMINLTIRKEYYQPNSEAKTKIPLPNGFTLIVPELTPLGARIVRAAANSAKAQALRRGLRKKHQKNKAKRNR